MMNECQKGGCSCVLDDLGGNESVDILNGNNAQLGYEVS